MIISTLNDLRWVINYERKRYGYRPINSWLGWMIQDILFFLHPGNPCFFMYCLRCEEFFLYRNKSFLVRVLRAKHKHLQTTTGIELFPGCAELGVTINHGKCVISQSAKIGRDCVILSDVTIGGTGGMRDSGAATIGNRVFVGSGARIIGQITIADEVVIGANAVVVKDIFESAITVAGVPAKKIKDRGSREYIP